MYKELGVYDMKNDEFKEMSPKHGMKHLIIFVLR